MMAEWAYRSKPTVLGVASGAIAGLAAVTPASGFVGPMPALIIGIAAGVICYAAVNLKTKFRYDDSLDVVGIHGASGTLGVIATGLFASKTINSAGNNGLFFGNPSFLWDQMIGVGAAWVYSFFITFAILKVLDWAFGLRVSEEEEYNGLDLSQHGESGYTL
jgi:Amt family ammonium transporter